jgi:integrase
VLRQELDDHKQKATEFTARFAEHEALIEDLARLEELYRLAEERLVQIETKNREKYPQVMVVEWAFMPTKPIWPHYMRDAGFVVAGSLLIALLMVWLVDYLTPKREAQHPPSPIDITIYPGEGAAAAIGQSTPDTMLESNSSPALESPPARELTEQEISSLYNAADSTTKQLIFLLLNGVSAKELLLIEREHIDLDNGKITVPGHSQRDLQFPAAISELFSKDGEPVFGWKESNEIILDREELDARLQLAALDGKLPGSEQIIAQDLRHTYISYLVRQGVRLSELEQIVGKMPSKVLLSYRQFLPAESDKPLKEICTIYPLFSD